MDYERGLEQLKQLVRGTIWSQEFLTYEARLRENLRDERLFGRNEQTQASRAQIVSQLNRLASEQFGISFNDLCSNHQVPPVNNQKTSSNAPSTPPARPASQRTKAFIGFNPEDQRYLNELHRHLDQYVQKGTVDYWDDTKILPGKPWKEEMKKALRSAKVAILLVSVDFLASSFIDQEILPDLLTAAREEGTVIINVLVGYCAFEESDLAQYRAVNTQPLGDLTQSKREKVWRNVAMQVRDILQADA